MLMLGIFTGDGLTAITGSVDQSDGWLEKNAIGIVAGDVFEATAMALMEVSVISFVISQVTIAPNQIIAPCTQMLIRSIPLRKPSQTLHNRFGITRRLLRYNATLPVLRGVVSNGLRWFNHRNQKIVLVCGVNHVFGSPAAILPHGYQRLATFGHLIVTDGASRFAVALPFGRKASDR